MDKKCTIFISSTFEDLKKERKNIINLFLKNGDFPISMENFFSSNGDTFDYIKKYIDDSDFFILIVGEKYGSICEKTNLSYTEMEYDYAVQKGMKPLVFVKETKNRDKTVSAFLEKISNNNCIWSSWKNSIDLIGSIISSYGEQKQTIPYWGWIRGNNFPNLKVWRTQSEARDSMQLDYKETKSVKILAIRGNSLADQKGDLNFLFSRPDVNIMLGLSDGENERLLRRRSVVNSSDITYYKKELDIAKYKIVKNYLNKNKLTFFSHNIDLCFRLIIFDNALYVSFFGVTPAKKSEVYRYNSNTQMFEAFNHYFESVFVISTKIEE